MAKAKKKEPEKKELRIKQPPPKLNPKVLVNAPKEEAIVKATQWIMEGMSQGQVKEMILIHKRGEKSDWIATSIYNEAFNRIKAEYAKDRTAIVTLHTNRYDKAVKKLLNKDYSDYDFDTAREMKIADWWNALAVLYQKEKLLQIHTKSFQLKINNKVNARVKEKKVEWNLSKLTLEEKVDMLKLVLKSKKNTDELFSVIMNGQSQRVIEDIEHEEVSDKVPQLQLYKPEVATPLEQSGSTLIDIKTKIAETLKKKAEEEFKRKGAKV